jgi:hypothetical protein
MLDRILLIVWCIIILGVMVWQGIGIITGVNLSSLMKWPNLFALPLIILLGISCAGAAVFFAGMIYYALFKADTPPRGKSAR